MEQCVRPASQASRSRAVARFILLTDLPPRISRAGATRDPQRVIWSLVSANNRALGRAAELYSSVAECLRATAVLSEAIGTAAGSVLFHDAEAATGSYWSWLINLDGRQLAISAFRYRRRLECERSLHRFRAAVPVASPAAPTVFRLGTRLRSGQA